MTVDGTFNKGIIFLGMATISGAIAWTITRTNPGIAMGLMMLGLIGALICAVVTTFKPQIAAVTGSLYCILEGLVLGTVSSIVNAQYQGIVLNAVVITLGLLLLMFWLYKARIVKATPTFVKVIMAATGAIALAYIIEMVARLFGAKDLLGLWSNGFLGIGISLAIIAVAAFNFILDFARIEQGAEQGSPKFMEWYCAFGVMVTLFWLYFEVLRLLMKLQDRR